MGRIRIPPDPVANQIACRLLNTPAIQPAVQDKTGKRVEFFRRIAATFSSNGVYTDSAVAAEGRVLFSCVPRSLEREMPLGRLRGRIEPIILPLAAATGKRG
jgi:hypothetical protein